MVVSVDVHKGTHTALAVDEVGRELGGGRCGRPRPVIGSCCGGCCASSLLSSCDSRWRIAGTSRLGWSGSAHRRAAGGAGARRSWWPAPGPRRGRAVSPIRSMRWPSPGQRRRSRTCQSRAMTRSRGRSSCSSITGKTFDCGQRAAAGQRDRHTRSRTTTLVHPDSALVPSAWTRPRSCLECVMEFPSGPLTECPGSSIAWA